jgi:5-methylthioadenosine/S-adenosylhomocysteine deaminase
VCGGVIEQVLPSEAAARACPDGERVELPEHVLIPGLVNAHVQAASALLRGLSETRRSAAGKGAFSARFVRDGTALACAEMLRGGVTCFGDTGLFPEAALEAALEAGLRVALALLVTDEATAYASDRDDYLRKGLDLRDRNREQPRASFCLAPRALSDAGLRRIATLAAELDLPVHVLVHGAEGEIERLQRLELLGPGLAAVHAVRVNEREIALLARNGCSVVHCPSSDLGLARGFAPVHSMLEHGINLALGTDGAVPGGRLDLLSEMRLAALLAKAVAGDAGALPAHAALRAATLGGARALGLGERIGSIVPGKRADLVAVALRGPELFPCYDPVSLLAYSAGREHVTHVWIDGEPRNPDLSLDTRWRMWQNLFESRADS